MITDRDSADDRTEVAAPRVGPEGRDATTPRSLRPGIERMPATNFPKALRRSFKSEVRMVPGTVRVDGRTVRFAVSDNETDPGPDGPGSPPVWAVNVHGFFAGGGMYWRESARLAEDLGWRLVTPSLPGFGGSDPLPPGLVSMGALSDQVEMITRHLGAGPAVLLGHSMGGAVAVRYATDHPERTLGIVYRDGVATPAWRRRRGLLPAVVSPWAPELAALADLVFSVAIDIPDLFMGRVYSTIRSMLPDTRRNLRSLGLTMPVGNLLLSVDQSAEVAELARQDEVPILPVWGIADRVAHPATAEEFEELSRAEVQWVPGGHSWMLARPQGQSDLLRHLPRGVRFLEQVEERWRRLHGRPALRDAG